MSREVRVSGFYNPHASFTEPSPDVVQHFAGQPQYWRRLSHPPPAGVPSVTVLENHVIYGFVDELYRSGTECGGSWRAAHPRLHVSGGRVAILQFSG